MELDTDKFLNVGILLVATVVVAKLISVLLIPRSRKRLPPVIKALPLVGSLVCFLKGPIVMIREEYQKLGSVLTVNLVHNNITFLISPEVSAHFFKASESDLSQQEVYQFNVPTLGIGIPNIRQWDAQTSIDDSDAGKAVEITILKRQGGSGNPVHLIDLRG